VASVAPAGIPGVAKILANPKFRIIATINDLTIDDIVFPISEGLARRFVRIDLRGATLENVLSFLDPGEGDRKERFDICRKVVSDFFSACDTMDKTTDSELGNHLRFGVGYFVLLRAWINGKLSMSKEFLEWELEEQVIEILSTALRSATRDKGYGEVFDLLKKGGTAD